MNRALSYTFPVFLYFKGPLTLNLFHLHQLLIAAVLKRLPYFIKSQICQGLGGGGEVNSVIHFIVVHEQALCLLFSVTFIKLLSLKMLFTKFSKDVQPNK